MPNKLLIVKLFNKISVTLKQITNTSNQYQLSQPLSTSTDFIKSKLKRLFNIPDYILACIKSPKTTIRKLWHQKEATQETTELSVELDMQKYFKSTLIKVERASLNIKTSKKILNE